MKRNKTKKLNFSAQERVGWLFVAPWIFGFVLLTVVPMAVSLYMSFHEWDMFSKPVFVGFDNYFEILSPSTFEGATFYAALGNTILYTLFTALINLVLGLSVAWAISKPSHLNTVLKTVIYLPCMLIGIAFAMMMGPIFGSSEFSLINQLRAAAGFGPQEWLFTKGQGVWIMVLMSFWGIGGAMIVFLAGVKNIDRSIYEAAEIDGACNFTVFTRICIPCMKPVIIYQVIMGLIFGMQVFDIAVGLASIGGAGSSLGMGIDNSLATLVYYLYNKGFKDFQMGFASAIGWLIFLLTSMIGAGLYFFVRKTGYYEVE
jgi:multiple sugar transport system permease protein